MTGQPGAQGGLTARQRRFVAEYLVDLNATAAALRAGYSPRTAAAIGSENLTKPEIAAAVRAGLAAQYRLASVRADEVVRELRCIAMSDVRRLFRDGRLLRLEELDAEIAAAVASIEVVARDAGEGAVEHVTKVKLWDKPRALEALARRAWPERRGAPVRFTLPPLATPGDAVKAVAALAQAVARGDLTPEEGQAVAAVVETHRRTLETAELAERIAEIERQTKSTPSGATDDG